MILPGSIICHFCFSMGSAKWDRIWTNWIGNWEP